MDTRRLFVRTAVLVAVILAIMFGALWLHDGPIVEPPQTGYGFDSPERVLDHVPKHVRTFDETDPCFQQDPECYIGRSVPGKNGQTCVIIDAVGNVRCNKTSPD